MPGTVWFTPAELGCQEALAFRGELREAWRRALDESCIRTLDEQRGEVQFPRQRHPFVRAQHHERGIERVGADGERVDDGDRREPMRQWTPGPRIQDVRDPLAVDLAILAV